jgi:hypothetical protein
MFLCTFLSDEFHDLKRRCRDIDVFLGQTAKDENENDADERNDKDDHDEDKEEEDDDENYQNKDIGAPATVSCSLQSWTSCTGSTLRGTGSQAYSDRKQEHDWEHDIPMFLHMTRHALSCSNSISLTPRLSRHCFKVLQVMVLLVLGCNEWNGCCESCESESSEIWLGNWRSLAVTVAVTMAAALHRVTLFALHRPGQAPPNRHFDSLASNAPYMWIIKKQEARCFQDSEVLCSVWV